MLEKDEEDEDWVGKGPPDLGQEKATMKAFPLKADGGPLFIEGHHTVLPPKMPSFEGPNMSGDASMSKQARRYHWATSPTHQHQGSMWELRRRGCVLVN